MDYLDRREIVHLMIFMLRSLFLTFIVSSLISKAPRPWAGGWSICLVYSRIVHINVLVSRGEPSCHVFLVAYYFFLLCQRLVQRLYTFTGTRCPTCLVVQMHAIYCD